MTDDQRELAEWVARWAGWNMDPNHNWLFAPASIASKTEVEALAWRAMVELAQITADFRLFKKGIDGWIGEWFMPRTGTVAEYAARPEIVVFRALRAAKGEG